MKEYIEREAARDLMEQALVDDWEIQYADDRLDEIPAADVVLVVRCGECKHRDEKTGWCEDVRDYISNTNWYCAAGERREEGKRG